MRCPAVEPDGQQIEGGTTRTIAAIPTTVPMTFAMTTTPENSSMSVSEVADALSAAHGVVIPPRAITMAFYERALRNDLCPIVGGKRRIPADYLPQIEALFRRRGRIPSRAGR
jgi:hypothetical protein